MLYVDGNRLSYNSDAHIKTVGYHNETTHQQYISTLGVRYIMDNILKPT